MKPEQKRLAEVIDCERRAGRPPRIVILKSRRIGASTLVEAELFRECHLTEHKQALVVAHKAESAVTIFDMSRLFYDELPESIKPPTKYSNKRMISFAHNGSKMQVEVAGESRGFTAQYLHISELAFIDGAEKLMTAILHTAPDDPDSLVIAESTPNGVGNYFHDLWVNAVAGKNGWVPFFSPWFDDPTYRMTPWFTEADLSPRDAKMMADHNLTLDQVAWYMRTRSDKCNGDQDVMDQENASDPISCFLASGRKVFDTDGLRHYEKITLAARLAGELPPESEIDLNVLDVKAPAVRVVSGGRWRIYRPPQPRHLYILGADISAGDPGSDRSPLVVINRHTLDVDAVFLSRTPPDLLARQAHVAGWWYNRAQIAGEANNHGLLFFDELMKRLHYPNIYYRKVNEESVAGKVSDKPGVWTSGATREGLINLTRRYVREHIGRCIDPDMLKEWLELFYDDKERVDHPKNGSLDLTMALTMALYVHVGSFENTLEPLPLSVVSRAPELYRELQSRRSMGQSTAEIEATIASADMTMDDLVRMDDVARKRENSRRKAGLGGFR
jgi:hypothetical protein